MYIYIYYIYIHYILHIYIYIVGYIIISYDMNVGYVPKKTSEIITR